MYTRDEQLKLQCPAFLSNFPDPPCSKTHSQLKCLYLNVLLYVTINHIILSHVWITQ